MRIGDVELGTHYRQQCGGRVRVDDITYVQKRSYAWGSSGIRNERRLLVTPVDWETGEPHEGQQQLIIPARELAETWDTHVAKVTSRRELEHERQEAVDVLNEALEDLPGEARTSYSGAITIRFTAAQAREFAAWINAARAVTPH